MAKAQSRYKQVRLTITEEAGGWITVRVLAKPVDAGWTFKHSVWHHRWRVTAPTPHWLDLVAHAMSALGLEDVLPRD